MENTKMKKDEIIMVSTAEAVVRLDKLGYKTSEQSLRNASLRESSGVVSAKKNGKLFFDFDTALSYAKKQHELRAKAIREMPSSVTINMSMEDLVKLIDSRVQAAFE